MTKDDETLISESSNKSSQDLDLQNQAQIQLPKEQSLFSGGLNDPAYLESLIYLEVVDESLNSLSRTSTSSTCGTTPSHGCLSNPSTVDYESCYEEEARTSVVGNSLNEHSIKEKLKSHANELYAQLQSLYVLYGNRAILATLKPSAPTDDVAHSLVTHLASQHGVHVQRRVIPYTTATPISALSSRLGNNVDIAGSSSLMLVSEMTDQQLALIAQDKSEALKLIEARTGLRLRKIKKNVYFTGLLFQFVLLNAFMADRAREQAVTSTKAANKTTDYNNMHTESRNDSTSEKVGNSSDDVCTKSSASTLSSSPSASACGVIPRSPGLDWLEYYAKSERRYQFRVKSIHLPTFTYECYVFQADLTDLNCDVLVNASNASLHPGYYTGEGSVSRRVREKGGKQMQDSLKKILAQIAPNKLVDSDVVTTKSHGRLRSRCVLHAVTPSWSKYVLERNDVSGFEPRMECTLHNVLMQAHTACGNATSGSGSGSGSGIRSIGFPVASPQTGGAFDMPCTMFAHLLYSQLAQFELDAATMNLELDRVCICSMEPQIVAELCDIFAVYAEMCEQTSWALPQSPMSALLNEIYPNEQFDLSRSSPDVSSLPPTPPSSQPVVAATTATFKNDQPIMSSNPTVDVGNVSSLLSTTTDDNKQQQQKQQKQSVFNSSDESATTSSDEHHSNVNKSAASATTQSIPIPPSKEDTQPLSSSIVVTTNSSSNSNYFCVFCQREKNLFRCGNATCTCAFCSRCLSNIINKSSITSCNGSTQVASKCPGCKHIINRDLVIRITNTYSSSPSSSSSSSSSSSLSISPVRIQHQQQGQPQHQQQQQQQQQTVPVPYVSARRFNHSGSAASSITPPSTPPSASTPPPQSVSPLSSHARYPFCEAKIYIRKLDQPCEGYEDFKSIVITFDVPDGIQNAHHPKPGQPYKGTIKRAYLPEIKEHVEILAFYERALKAGLLFKLEWSRPTTTMASNQNPVGDFRVLLNQDVILKTSQRGGGKFGYPDSNYIENLLKFARSSFN